MINFRSQKSKSNVPVKNWQLSEGFTLVEILLFLLVVLVMVTILVSSAGTFAKIRKINLESTASGIGKCEIERLRKLNFASLPVNGSSSIGNPCDQDLSKLPTPNSATREMTDYQSDPDIKQVTVTIAWTESGINQDIKLETLLSRYGL